MEVSVSPPYTHASMAVPPLEKDMPKGSSASPAAIPTKPQDADAVKKKDVLETEQGRAVVPSRYIVRMVGSIVRNSTHDTPIHDLSPFRVGKMRLSFSDTLEDAPYAVPLMDRATFLSRAKELLHSDWDRELDPEIMPPGIPDYFLECEDDAKPARPAYCWGLLFHWAYLEFSQRSIYFFRNCLESINHQNPDMMWEETPVTRATEFVSPPPHVFQRVPIGSPLTMSFPSAGCPSAIGGRSSSTWVSATRNMVTSYGRHSAALGWSWPWTVFS